MVKHKGRLIYKCKKCKHYHFSGSKVYENHWDYKESQPWERMYE